MCSKIAGRCGDGTTAVAGLCLAASKLQARQQKIGRSNSKFHALAHQVKQIQLSRSQSRTVTQLRVQSAAQPNTCSLTGPIMDPLCSRGASQPGRKTGSGNITACRFRSWTPPWCWGLYAILTVQLSVAATPQLTLHIAEFRMKQRKHNTMGFRLGKVSPN